MNFKKLLEGKLKSGKTMSDKDQKAAKEVCSEMECMMKELMGENLKRVTVAAPDAEGLKAGLEKAKEVIEEKEGNEEESDEVKLLKAKLAKLQDKE